MKVMKTDEIATLTLKANLSLRGSYGARLSISVSLDNNLQSVLLAHPDNGYDSSSCKVC